MSMSPRPQRKSNLWKYFENKALGKDFVICRFCSKKIKTSGNTTNLKYHLNSRHKGVLQNKEGEKKQILFSIQKIEP